MGTQNPVISYPAQNPGPGNCQVGRKVVLNAFCRGKTVGSAERQNPCQTHDNACTDLEGPL